jgi:hypothetical protein
MKVQPLLAFSSATLLGLSVITFSQGGLSRTRTGDGLRINISDRKAEMREVGNRLLRLDSQSGLAEVLQLKGNLEGASYFWAKIPESGDALSVGNYQFLYRTKGLASSQPELLRMEVSTGKTWRTTAESNREMKWEPI